LVGRIIARPARDVLDCAVVARPGGCGFEPAARARLTELRRALSGCGKRWLRDRFAPLGGVAAKGRV
jgi:hypothetical protein